MTPTERIDRYIATHEGRYPRNDTVAKGLGTTVAEADKILDEHRRTHGKRIRSGAMGRVQEAGQDQSPDTGAVATAAGSGGNDRPGNTRRLFDFAVDGGALILAVVIDLLLNAVVFWVIAPDLVTRIGMVCLSFIVVLFSLRGWMKGGWIGKSLWLMFAIVATFSDISFALSATELQATVKDYEVVRLDDAVTKAQGYLESLQSLQLSKGQGYAQQVREATEARDKASAARLAYVSPERQMTSDKVFSAIPDAVTDGRWIQLVFFTLIFSGLQLTIVSSATRVKTDATLH